MPFFVGPFPFIFSFSLVSEVYGLLLSESRQVSLYSGKQGLAVLILQDEKTDAPFGTGPVHSVSSNLF